jgi:hypothetical protein
MNPFAPLLDLQDHDTTLDQLRHRRETLPDRALLKDLDLVATALASRRGDVAAEREVLAREQRRLEGEAGLIEAKADAEDKRLYSGTVTAPKELSAIQDEIKALKRHQGALEDQVIEHMEAIEPLDAELAVIDADLAANAAAVDSAHQRLTVAEAEIDVDIDRVLAERDELAAGVAPGVLSQYEALRRTMSGVAVARLDQGSCRGCHLQLSKVELDRIRREPDDAVVHCEECGRILVR